MTNEYEAAVDAALAEPKVLPLAVPRAKNAMASAVSVNPDAEAELRLAADIAGVPRGAAQADPEGVKRQAQVIRMGLDGLTTAPATLALAGDHDAAPIVHDQIQPLAQIEALFGAMRKAIDPARLGMGGATVGIADGLSRPKGVLTAGLSSGLHTAAGVGLMALQQAYEVTGGMSLADQLRIYGNPASPSFDPGRAARLQANKPQGFQERLLSSASFFERQAIGQFKAAGKQFENLPEDQRAIYGKTYATTDPAKAAWADPRKLGADVLTNLPTMAALAFVASRGTSAGNQAAAQALVDGQAAGLAAGEAAAAAQAARVAATVKSLATSGAITEGAVGGLQQGSQAQQDVMAMPGETLAKSPEFKELTAAGFDPDVARIIIADHVGAEAGAVGGLADVVGSGIGGRILGRILASGRGAVTKALAGAAEQGIEEGVQSPLEQIGQNIAEQRADPLIDTNAGVLESALQGAFVGALTGAPIAAWAGRADVKTQEAEAATQDAEVLTKLNKMAAASKVRDRDPATFEAFIAQAAEGGPVESLYVDGKVLAEALQQNPEDYNPSPAMREAIDAAVKSGGDVQIAVEDFATGIAGTAVAEAILPHVRTEVGGFSQSEAEAYLKDQGPALQAEVQKLLTNQLGDEAVKASRQVVEDNIAAQLDKAARFTPDVNRAYAGLMSAFYSTQAQRLGTTPEELFAQHPVTIAAERLGVPSPALDQLPSPSQLNTPRQPTAEEMTAYGRVEDVPLAQVRSTQRKMEWDRFNAGDHPEALLDGFEDKPVAVRMENGEYLVMDGNHRTTLAIEAGKTALPMHVIDAKSFDPENAGRAPAADTGMSDDELMRELGFGQNTNAPKARGTFVPATGVISLLQHADLSTFLHEGAHFYLDILGKLASAPGAPAEIVADMDTVLKWFEVPDLDSWLAMTVDEQRVNHERFARGFEAYLFEGKAPSAELRPIMQRFKAWLVAVYQNTIGKLNVELTPDIRQVFDRLIASEQQIRENELAQGFAALFETKPDTMSEDEWSSYQALGAQATASAIEKLETRSIRDMKWLSGAKSKLLRQLQREAADKRKAIRAEVTAEVMAEPVNVARTFLKRGTLNGVAAEGPTKLEIADAKRLTKTYSDPDAYKLLGFGRYGMLAEDGMPADMAAEMLGYSSGDALVRDLLIAEDPAEKIAGMVDQRMLERYGDLTDPESIEVAADEALHNDARLKFVAAEHAALIQATGGKKLLNSAARDFAAQIVGRLKLRDLKPHRFSMAETRAANAAAKAHAKGDLVTAAAEKRNQLIQGYATRATHKAVAEVDKASTFFRRIVAGKDEALAKTRDMDFVNSARAVLAAYGVGRAKNQPEHYLGLIKDYDPSMYELLKPMVDSATVSAKSLDQISFDEFNALRDTINQLWFLSRRVKQIEIDGELFDRADVAKQLGDRLDELGTPERAGVTRALTSGELAVRQLSGVRAGLRRVEHWVRFVDGGGQGAFRKFLWQPISEAADAYRADKARYLTALRDIFQGLEATMRPGKIDAHEINYTFGFGARGMGKAELLHAILHTGNESNKRKLLLGRGWAKENADGTLNTDNWAAFKQRMYDEGVLTKADYDAAQAIWDLMDQTKEGAQKAHRNVFGRYFNEVIADPVDTPFGTYRGGYVPALTDPNLETDVAIRAQEDSLTSGSASTMFPSPAKGFTMSRVDYNKMLALDLSLIPRHLDTVLKFTHFAAPTQDAVRLLKARGLSGKLSAHDPLAMTDLLLPWLNRASKQITSEAPTSVGGRAFGRLATAVNSRVGLGIMFANVTNAIQQLTGWAVSAVVVKPRHLAGGLHQYVGDPAGVTERVRAASSFMATRTDNQISDINGHLDDLLLRPNLYEKGIKWTQKHGYFLQSAFQNIVDITTWVGAYDQATEGGAQDRDAIRAADAAVRASQGSLAPEDISRFEAGTPFVKLFTKFQSFFNNQANLLGSEFGATVRDLGLKRGAGRMLYVYTMGFMLPAVMAQALVTAARGGPEPDKDDDDSYLDAILDLIFGSQMRFAFGLLPGVGPVALAGVNAWNDKPYDDRISVSPAVSSLEGAVKAPQEIYRAIAEGGNQRAAIRDGLTLLTLLSGAPLTVLAKPLGYAADVNQGKVTPTGPVDAVRGAVTGSASPASKN